MPLIAFVEKLNVEILKARPDESNHRKLAALPDTRKIKQKWNSCLKSPRSEEVFWKLIRRLFHQTVTQGMVENEIRADMCSFINV